MAAGSSNDQAALGGFLGDNLAEIRQGAISDLLILSTEWFNQPCLIEMFSHFEKVCYSVDFESGYPGGLFGIGSRNDEFFSIAMGGQCGRKNAGNRANLPRERQFANQFVVVELLLWNIPCGCENADCDRQVKAAPLFGNVRRCKIDGDAPRREFKFRICDGRTHTLATLLHGFFGKANNDKGRQAVAQVGFNGYQRG